MGVWQVVGADLLSLSGSPDRCSESLPFGRHLGFNTVDFIPTSRGYDYHYGHYQAAVEAYNHTFGPQGTASPRSALDWHRNAVPVDGAGVSGRHTCQLLTSDFESKLKGRTASKPLFVYLAWHMVHMGDGVPNPPASVSEPKRPTKLLEAPPSYTAPFAHNASDIGRRTFLGMVSLVDEAVGNATAAWEAAGLLENGLVILSSDNGSPPDFRGLVGNLPLRGFKHQLVSAATVWPSHLAGAGAGV